MSFLPKIIAQAVFQGVKVFGKSVVETFKLAGRGAPAQESKEEVTSSISALLLRKMRPKEARKILNVEDNATKEEIDKSFERLLDANSPERGNSFYLQSKVFRSHELLTTMMKEQMKEPETVLDEAKIEEETAASKTQEAKS